MTTRSLTTLTLAALVASTIAAAPAAQAAQQEEGPSTSFLLNASVLDGGQQIVSLTVDTPDGVDPSSLDASLFTVHASGTNKYTGLDPERVSGEFDVDREVTGVALDKNGDVVIRLAHGERVEGAFTFGNAAEQSRNIMLDLDYTITQHAPMRLEDGTNLTYGGFDQGGVVDPEVDAFGSGTSTSGLRYRIYSPGTPRASLGTTTEAAAAARALGDRRAQRGEAKPLVVFLHGGGEGGWSKAYDNDLQLIANRGALGMATREAQSMFGGAYVVAPQAFTRWLDDERYDYTTRLKTLIDEVVAEKNVDPNRISVIGPSNGGFMAMKMVSAYPDFFAASVPVCGVVSTPQETFLTDEEITAMASTPTWFVHATNDPIVPFAPNSGYAHSLLPESILTTYPNIVRGGHEFNGHFAWVHTSRNDPKLADGTSLWEWMAAQSRD